MTVVFIMHHWPRDSHKMPIGSFRLNTLSAVGAAASSGWILQYNGSGSDTYTFIDQIAIDSSGNVYFVFGSTSPTLVGATRDAILVKTSSSGTVQAITRFNVNTNEIPYCVSVSGSDIIVGTQNGSAIQYYQFAASTLTRTQTFRIINSSSSPIRGIPSDGAGNFYFGYDNSSLVASTRVGYIIKATTSGITWSRQFSNTTYANELVWHTSYSSASSIVISLVSVNSLLYVQRYDSTGTAVSTYRLSGTSPAGPRNHTRPGLTTSFFIVGDAGAGNTSVTKISTSDTISWSLYASGYNNRGSATDSSGNIYVATVDATPAVSYITKFDTNGNITWQRNISVSGGGSSGSSVMGINCTDTDIYLQWYLFTSGGDDVTFVMKLPADGSKTGTYTNGSYSITIGTSSVSWTSTGFTWATASPYTLSTVTTSILSNPATPNTTSGLTATLTTI